MIQSILDNDLYKFTMQQAVRRRYPSAEAVYRFTDRGQARFPQGMAERITEKIAAMAEMALGPEERSWLDTTCPYFDPGYLDFLSAYRFDPDEVRVTRPGQSLDLTIQGLWQQTILWEVPLMALISETYFELTRPPVLTREAIRQRNREKAAILYRGNAGFADFGTRRRFSFETHDQLLEDILSLDRHTLAGTSNVHLARKWQLQPIGTMAHEWIMFHGALGGYAEANPLSMNAWKAVYPDTLSIALTDTYTTGLFLKHFNREIAGRFDGVRQDSGDPLAFAETLIDHYRSLGIDPAGKTIVFSDGLDAQRAVAIQSACQGRIKTAFGIGTHLTNDVGPAPLNMVIKMSQCRPSPGQDWQNTVKLSDDPGKHTGDRDAIDHCLAELGLEKKKRT